MWSLRETTLQAHADSFIYWITQNQRQVPFPHWQSAGARLSAPISSLQPQTETQNNLSPLHEEIFPILAQRMYRELRVDEAHP